ncbi:Uncharacterised protein [Vibrio cholerae]|nr:Uncharacterised protein [Vibrio cholerae]
MVIERIRLNPDGGLMAYCPYQPYNRVAVWCEFRGRRWPTSDDWPASKAQYCVG